MSKAFRVAIALAAIGLAAAADNHRKQTVEEGPSVEGGTRKVNPACADPSPFVDRLMKAMAGAKAKGKEISQVLEDLKLPMSGKTRVGATISSSLQASLCAQDPRVMVETECFIVTFTLYGKSIEVAIKDQLADTELPPNWPYKTKLKSEPGGIYLDVGPFPSEGKFDLAAITNRPDPTWKKGISLRAYDTKRCTGCHVDAGEKNSTRGAFGLKTISVGGQSVQALVNPYAGPGEGGGFSYCVPTELQKIMSCLGCGGRRSGQDPACAMVSKDCDGRKGALRGEDRQKAFQATLDDPGKRVEACRRLEAVVRLAPLRMRWFDPKEKCLFTYLGKD